MAYLGNSQFQGIISGGNIQDGSIESIDLATLTNIDINSGSIDNTIIGAATANVGTFTDLSITTSASFGDNVKAKFGDSDDLQIYHDGNKSVIQDSGAGDLILQAGNDLILRATDGVSEYLRANEGLGVQIFYNGSQKFLTTSTGVTVTGTATADGLNIDGGGTIRVGAGGYNGRLNFPFSCRVNIDSDNNETGEKFTIGRDQENDAATNQILVARENGDVEFYEDTGTDAKMVWDASAEALGINETSPGSNTAFGGGVKLQTADDTNTGYSVTGSGRLPYGTQLNTYNIAASSSSLSGIGLLNRGPGGASMGSYIGSLGASSGWGASIVFGMTSGSSSYTERMRIDSNGRLGIGTSSPSNAKVHIVGDGSYVGNYGYNTLRLEDLSGYPGINFKSGNNNWLQRTEGPTANMQWVFSSDATDSGVGSYQPMAELTAGGQLTASNIKANSSNSATTIVSFPNTTDYPNPSSYNFSLSAAQAPIGSYVIMEVNIQSGSSAGDQYMYLTQHQNPDATIRANVHGWYYYSAVQGLFKIDNAGDRDFFVSHATVAASTTSDSRRIRYLGYIMDN
jgi:hypothetical protein